jgi:lipooligosaccharide transport system permease protein
VANLNPLYHLVELVRHAAFGFETTDLIRIAVLVGFALGLWRLAVARLEKRLIN